MRYFLLILFLFLSSLSASENGSYGIIQKEYGLQSGMVGYWKFNEGSGATAGDSSGQGNNETINGASWVNGKYGNGLDFDGNNDYLQKSTASFCNDTQGTLMAWVKFGNFTTDQIVFALSQEVVSGYDEYYLLYFRGDLAGDPLQVSVVVNGLTTWGALTNGGLVQSNLWYHFVITSDGIQTRLYLNGVERTLTNDIGTNSGQWFATATDANCFGMGAIIRDAPVAFFTGQIDESAIFNRYLTQAEIERLRKTVICIEEAKRQLRKENPDLVWQMECELARLLWTPDGELTDWTDLYLKQRMRKYVNKNLNNIADLLWRDEYACSS